MAFNVLTRLAATTSAKSLPIRRRFVVVVALLAFFCNWEATAQTKSNNTHLTNAHAHNDYQHERPLLDALELGFGSIEVDIFLVGDELLVGHDRWSLNKKKTLRSLYLDSLREITEQRNGRIYLQGPPLMLLIDFKAQGKKIYPILQRQLEPYKAMLSGMHNGQYQDRAVQIVISGDCPRALIKEDKNRLVAIDGRLGDLNSNAPASLIPLISAKWGSNFKWRGRTELPDEEREKLKTFVDRAHRSKRRLRFWATPESERVWATLLDVGVDHINTDDLRRLHNYLKTRQ